MERVPETYEATKQLLLYGLHGTDAKVVKALGSKKGPLPFIIKTKEDEEGEEDQEKKDFLEFERYIKWKMLQEVYTFKEKLSPESVITFMSAIVVVSLWHPCT